MEYWIFEGLQAKAKVKAGREEWELQFFSLSVKLFLSVNLHSTLDIRLFQSLAGSIPCGLFSKKISNPSFPEQGYRFSWCKVQTRFLLWPENRVPM